MKEVRALKKGDIIRLNYGVDNYIKVTVDATEVHTTWTKLWFRPEGRRTATATWIYTDAVVEWLGEEDD